MLSKYFGVFLFLVLLAEILGTVGGFGSSVFFVPVANYFFKFQTVLGLTALFHLASNVVKIAFFKKRNRQKSNNLLRYSCSFICNYWRVFKSVFQH